MPPITGPAIQAFDELDDELDDEEEEEVLEDPLEFEVEPGEDEDEELIAAYVATANSDTVFVVFCR